MGNNKFRSVGIPTRHGWGYISSNLKSRKKAIRDITSKKSDIHSIMAKVTARY